jgi:hypothetical protein
MAEKSPPIHKIKSGFVTAAIWRQEGKNGPFHTVTMSRSYKTENDQGEEVWKDATSWSLSDLPHVSALALRAQIYIGGLDDAESLDEAA